MESWLIDCSAKEDGIQTVWVDSKSNHHTATFKTDLEFYIVSGHPNTKQQLESHPLITQVKDVKKFLLAEDLQHGSKKPVLEVSVPPNMLRRVYLDVRDKINGEIHHSDLTVTQSFCFKTGMFPFCKADIQIANNRLQNWEILDSYDALDYAIPPLRNLWLTVEFDGNQYLGNPVKRATIMNQEEEVITIEEESETEAIFRTCQAIAEEDPDVIITQGGDASLFFLSKRASQLGIGSVSLSRDGKPLSTVRYDFGGTSFSTYGRVSFSAKGYYLSGGRLHFDLNNSFLWHNGGMEGIAEVSRLSCIDPQRISRQTIGTALTAMQVRRAYLDDLLIPSRKSDSEDFRSATTFGLDRGGFIWNPLVGLHEQVAEIDFVSMYPSIMVSHNISPETVNCGHSHCKSHNVPETHYYTCLQKDGLVPRSLVPILKKRNYYKRKRRESESYNNRQEILKWLLVTCFGYMGYRNARFGRIEAHECINAYGRDSLLRLSRVAEKKGYEVVAGIVDSLWIKKEGNKFPIQEIQEICEEGEKETSLPIDIEGIYKWIIFLPRKHMPQIGVLNRYWGVFEDETIKCRGIELRRRDSPPIVKNAQRDMIDVLKTANNHVEFVEKLKDVRAVVMEYANRIKDGGIPWEDFLITTVLSKNPADYVQNCHQAIAGRQLVRNGFPIRPGMKIHYVICDANATDPNKRVIADQLADNPFIDEGKYIELVEEAAKSLLPPGILEKFENYGRQIKRPVPLSYYI